MREPKFRYTYQHMETGRFLSRTYNLSCIEGSDPNLMFPERPRPNNPPMTYILVGRDEYTGLKDKNGKEIYEGDILHYDAEEWGNDGIDFVIQWDSDSVSFVGAGIATDWPQWCSVMGNIYETPEPRSTTNSYLEQAKDG